MPPQSTSTSDAPSDAPEVLTLVEGGKSDYAIIFQDQRLGEPSAVATRREACVILRDYIRKATGVTLKMSPTYPVPTPPNGRPYKYIFVGDSDYLRGLGDKTPDEQPNETPAVDLTGFGPETYLLRVVGQDLVLAGLDGAGDPYYFHPVYGRTNTPTMHAVSRFLELFIGARWFWPVWHPEDEKALAGNTHHTPGFGEHHLTLDRLEVPKTLDTRAEPSFPIRDLRLAYDPENLPQKFSQSFRKKLARRNALWLRLNRVGVFDRIWHQHYWWFLMPKAKYATPDGAQLDPHQNKFFAYYDPAQYRSNNPTIKEPDKRKRGGAEQIQPLDNGKPTKELQDNQLCVSGRRGDDEQSGGEDAPPEVVLEMVAAIREQLKDRGLRAVTIAPNDGFGHCNCDPCRAKDLVHGTDAPDLTPSGARNTGDRMFGFFNAVADLLREEFPDIWVTTYAYGNYILPYTLKTGDGNEKFLRSDRLIVFETHNGYGFKYYDTQTREEVAGRVKCWGSTARTAGDAWLRQVAVYTHPYHTDTMFPYFNNLPMSGVEPLADNLARMMFYHYAGGFFQLPGVGHWPHRYLLARLLDEMPPPSSTEDGALDEYINEVRSRAEAVLDEYYRGLFGDAAKLVARVDQLLADRLAAYVRTGVSAAGSYANAVYNWSEGTLLAQVFLPIRAEVERLLFEDAPQVVSTAKERAHLSLIQTHWRYAFQSVTLFEGLDVYANLSPELAVYDDQQLRALDEVRTLMWGAGRPRAATVAGANDEVNNPDLCALVLWPGIHTPEYEAGEDAPGDGDAVYPPLVLKTKHDSTWETVKKMVPTSKIIRTILAVQHDLPARLPDEKEAREAPRRPPGETYLDASYASGDEGKVWLDRFGRSGDKSYIVALNDSSAAVRVTLSIKNMDPRKDGRQLFGLDGVQVTYTKGAQPSESSPHFDPNKDETRLGAQSKVVTDTAVFDARPGVTILVLREGNFAPYALKVSAYNSATRTYGKTFKLSQLASVVLQMHPEEDLPLAGAKFHLNRVDDKGVETPFDDLEGIVVRGGVERPFYEYVKSVALTTGKDPIIKTAGTYKIYGALYDVDGVKRFATDANGVRHGLLLEVEED